MDDALRSKQAAADLQQATRTVPIVFTIVVDPVGAGLVESLARPGKFQQRYGMGGHSLRNVWYHDTARAGQECERKIGTSSKRMTVKALPVSSPEW